MFEASGELLLILVVALIVVGPSKLPELIRSFGKGLAEFRRMTSDVKATLEREIERADELKRIGEIKKELFDEADKAKQVLNGVAQDVGGQMNEVGGQIKEVAREAGAVRPETLEAGATADEQAMDPARPAVDQTGEPLTAEAQAARSQGQAPSEAVPRETASPDIQGAPGAAEEQAPAQASAPTSSVVSSELGGNTGLSSVPSPESSPEPKAAPAASPASKEEKSHA